MKLSALNYLVCPKCHGAFHLKEGSVVENGALVSATGAEIIEGTLDCASCAKHYAITRGVPRFVDEKSSSKTDIFTGSRFGQSWKSFPRMDERYRQQFLDWIFPVDSNYFKDKVILEGGCGKGRHAKIVSESNAKEIFAVDIGDAVDVAFANVGRMPGVHIIQADICELPFKQSFDFVFSLGVLHHLHDPYKGFLALSKLVKPDGALCVWVYGRENNKWLVTFVNPIRVAFTSKLPEIVLNPLSAVLGFVLYLLVKLFVHPWSILVKRFRWLPKFYYQDYLSYIAKHDFLELHSIVYDHLVTPVAHYIPRAHFSTWFKKIGVNDPIIRWHNKNSWTGFFSNKLSEMASMRARVDQPDPAVAQPRYQLEHKNP